MSYKLTIMLLPYTYTQAPCFNVREIVCVAIDLLYMLKELNVSSSTQISNLFLKVKVLSNVNMKLVVGSPPYFIHYTLSYSLFL